MVVIAIAKLAQGSAEFIQIAKATDPQHMLFEGAEEALEPIRQGTHEYFGLFSAGVARVCACVTTTAAFT